MPIKMTPVDGYSQWRGAYALDGSLNVTETSGVTPVGLYAKDGSMNITVIPKNDGITRPLYARDGSMNVTIDPTYVSGPRLVELASASYVFGPLVYTGYANSIISVTRAGDTATYFNNTGFNQTALANTARISYSLASSTFRGLIIEPPATNSLRNSTMAGASAPSTMPTNWSLSTNGGLTETIVGVGTENGLPYIDLRLSGTPTGTSYSRYYDQTTQVVAAATEVWTGSVYLSLVGGSLINATFRSLMVARTAAGGFIAQNNPSVTPSATLTRHGNTYTMPATTERVQFGFGLTLTVGLAVDLTVRIAAPQLELGGFTTSFIPTSTVAVTRNGDNASISISDFSKIWNSTENTIQLEFELRNNATGLQQSILDIHNGTSDERIQIVVTTVGNVSFIVHTGAVQVVNQTLGAAATGLNKVAVRVKADNMTGALNGVVQSTDTSCGMPSVTRAQIGANRAFTGNTIMSGWVKYFRIIQKGFTNTELGQMST